MLLRFTSEPLQISKPIELKTQRTLKSKDAEKCVGRSVECMMPGYQLAGHGFDAMGRPLAPHLTLTHDVLSRGRLELTMAMNTIVQVGSIATALFITEH